MKRAFLSLIILALVSHISRADDMKIASVDVNKIFQEWNYASSSEEKIREARELLERQNNDRLAVINEYQMLRGRMLQQFKTDGATMSDEDKKQLDEKFKNLGREGNALEQDRRDFFSKNNRRHKDEISSAAKLILHKIIQEAQSYALEQNFDMVIEMGGTTTSNLPLFIHLEGAVDITGEIIKRLNESAQN